jgi:hypothetical protein
MEGKMQKFNKGDHVMVAKDLGSTMSHFQNDCEAIVIGSYADEYGGDNVTSYTLHIKGSGKCSWYKEHQLELINRNCLDLLEQWETERRKEADIKSNLDWIFDNGKDVLKGAHGASVASLARCFGLDNLWGSRGEGFTYFSNSLLTLQMAKPYLESGYKDGWLKYCADLEL